MPIPDVFTDGISDSVGDTPIHLAAAANSVDSIVALTDAGASLSQENAVSYNAGMCLEYHKCVGFPMKHFFTSACFTGPGNCIRCRLYDG